MLWSIAAGVALAAAAAASRPCEAATAVTACGQLVRGQAELSADLDCSAFAGDAVTLDTGSALRLNGFTLTGTATKDFHSVAVRCWGRCRVRGPGAIVTATTGVSAHLTAVGQRAIQPHARIDDVVISASIGVMARNPFDGSARLGRCTLDGGDFGVLAQRSARLAHSTITGHASSGVVVSGGPAVLVRSTVSGNGTNPCGGPECGVDLATAQRPRLGAASSCGTSRDLTALAPWGVCSSD